MSYDGRLVCYASGYQLRLYSKALREREDREEEVSVELDPFSNQPVLGTFDDPVFDASEDLPDDPERSVLNSYARTRGMIYYLARSNLWTHFVTLTFSPEFVDRYDYDACAKKLKGWLDRIRRSMPELKYLIVPELHTGDTYRKKGLPLPEGWKPGAVHFHGLFSGLDARELKDTGQTDRHGRPVYRWESYKWGWTDVTLIEDTNKASGYITKYVTKDLLAVSEGRKRYWASRNLDKAPIFNFLSFDFAGHWARKAYREDFFVRCLKEADFVKTTASEFLETYYMEFPADSEVIRDVNETFSMWLSDRRRS